MKYLVSMTSPSGRAKTITVEAESCKTAAEVAQNRYVSFEINRVSADSSGLSYFDEIRKHKQN